MIAGQASPEERIEEKCEISTLGFDIFEVIFDFSTLKNVIAMSRTSKQYLGYAGTYFYSAYSSKEVLCCPKGFYIERMCVNHFTAFIRKISIWFGHSETFAHIRKSDLTYIEHVIMMYVSLHTTMAIKKILKQMKTLELHNCSIAEEFHESFFSFCENVQSLTIKDERSTQSTIIGMTNDWLQNAYPNMRHFGLELKKRSTKVPPIVAFFQNNPGIVSFSTNSELFCANFGAFSESKIKLQNLEINIESSSTFQDVAAHLRELEKFDFYKGLVLAFDYIHIDEDTCDELVSLSRLIGLRINDATYMTDTIRLAQNLKRLDFLVCSFAFIDHIIPFIQFSQHLKDLKVKMFGSGLYFQNGILNLKKLNKIRETVGSKMTLFVDEAVYVETKNSDPQFSESQFLRLKRFV